MSERDRDEVAEARVDAVVPDAVRRVCARLTEAGFQALAVGGAVRDALLGRSAGDWDVATSAHPDEVQQLFAKTIPTGIQHGTVTVVVGRGADRHPVEVTTFRGEGAYSDARRPDEVFFGVPLEDDLARRDFVINAIAFDPVAHRLVDPFGGREDLRARLVRAVGDPLARFTEDGLRVMRAIRFAAVLEFTLDPATEAAIPAALPSLAQVSKERVHDELLKMLKAPAPSVGLELARRTGVLTLVLPEVGDPEPDEWARALARANVAAEPPLRLAAFLALLAPADPVDAATARAPSELAAESAAAAADGALRRLKFSTADRERIVQAVRWSRAWRVRAAEPAFLRRLLALITRRRAGDVVALWRAEAHAWPGRAADIRAVADRCDQILGAGEPLSVGELPLGGGDVMRLLGLRPGRLVGQILGWLLDRVLDDPALAERARLEALLPEAHARLTSDDPGSDR